MTKGKRNRRSKRHRMGQIPLEEEFKGFGALRSIRNRLLHSAVRYFPMYPSWRVLIHRIRGVKIGRGVFIGSEVFIDNTYPESVVVEDFVTIISRTFIIGHSFTPVHLKNIFHGHPQEKSGVFLRKGCYIGAQSIIMPGVTVGEFSVVGAGSVVTYDIPPYSIAFGNPARVKRKFTESEVIQASLR